MSGGTTGFFHIGSIGDIWSAIPAMREYHQKTAKKVVLYLRAGVESEYYEGATHPTRNEKGNMCLLNEKMIEMMLPLLKAQPFIEDAKLWEGEKYDIDLSLIFFTYTGIPNFDIRRWYFYCFPDLACNLTEEYITVPETDKDFAKGKFIISRTQRYLNHRINYSFLKEYDNCVFSGTEEEHKIFCEQFDLNIPRLVVNDFLELAQAVKQCKFLLSNQTQIFALAQGIKTPRIVEVCAYVPNVIVQEKNAYDFLSQTAVEYYVKLLDNEVQ